MKRIYIIILSLVVTLIVGLGSVRAQIVDVCAGNDSVVLKLGNFHYGYVQWQVSDDNDYWMDINGAIDTMYRFLPEYPRYYRAEVRFPACADSNFYSQVSYVQMPPKANAGPDMSIPAGMVARLCASSFKGAEGEWHIIEGANGMIENASDPKTGFIGEEGEYKLTWTVTNSCGSNTDTVTVRCVKMEYQPNIVYVDETDAILSDSTQLVNGEYVIVFSDPVPDIQEGSVLLGYRDPSFLRKVVSFERVGDLFVMQTEQGLLTDIILSGALFIDQSSISGDGKKDLVKYLDRYPTRKEMSENPFLLRDGNIYILKNAIENGENKGDDWEVTAEWDHEEHSLSLGVMLNFGIWNDKLDGLIYEETVTLDPNLRSNIEHENGVLTECYLGLYDATFEHTVSLSIDKEFSVSSLEAKGTINKTPILLGAALIGGVPVTMSLDFPASCSLSAAINGLKVSFTSTTQFTSAIEYDPATHEFVKIHDKQPSVDQPDEFDLNGTIDFQIKAGVKFSLLIAGVLGPFVEWSGRLKSSICTALTPPYHVNADLNYGLDMDLGIRFHLFSDLLEADVSRTFQLIDGKEHAPQKITKFMGDNQVYNFGNYLTTPITVDVEGWFGSKLPLAKIYFEPEVGGEVTDPVVSTDIHGKASTRWRPNSPTGRDKLKVKAFDCHGDLIGGTPVVFHAYSSATDPCINSNLTVEAYHVQEDRIIPQVHGGQSPYLYSTDGESFSSTVPNIQTQPGHTYTFYVQDKDGCEAMTTYNEPFYDCENSSLMLSVTASGNVITAMGHFGFEPYWYSIDGINYQPTGLFGVQLDGEYTVYVRDALGCVDTKHVTVSREGNLYVWISEINGHSGTAEVMVSSDGLADRGVCWSTHHAPTVEDLHASYGNNAGPFPFTINGLDSETTYYVRAYALDLSGTSYSEERCINPGDGTQVYLPEVAATGITSLTHSSAVGSGNVTWDGGAEVTERGICWGTCHDPDLTGLHIPCGAGTGSFTGDITGLTPNKQYYARAYATNSAGTAYGDEVDFITLQNGGGGGGYDGYDNHQYVDLGLPSGTLWATCNVGAETPEENGNFFAWGEIQPKAYYNWGTYLYCHGDDDQLTKYCNNPYYGYNGFTDDLTTLLPEDDAATYLWGGHWCIPTKEQWSELCRYTSKSFTTQNGVRGELFTASNGNSLFLPYGSSGHYWTNVLYNPYSAWQFYFYSGGHGLGNFGTFRCQGNLIRPVRVVNPIGNLPRVSTSEVTAYTSLTATFEGVVVSDGGLSITRRGVCWSTHHNPFLTDDHIDVEAGVGTFAVDVAGLNQGTSYFVRAYAINALGIVYGNEVSFATPLNDEAPEGAVNGLFSVGETRQVYFSKGNLQYHISSGSWWFAENQYDMIGEENANISPYYHGKIDLFGWGTSGCDHGAVYYQPWSSVDDISGYHVYGCDSCNLYDYSGCADWGYNGINNGGTTLGSWRTPTKEEWSYLLFTRATSSNIRYAKGKVNGVNGLILLPDNWSSNYYSLSCTNQVDSNFESNILSAAQWNQLQQHGAVFLPAAGWRHESITPFVSNVGSIGYYWSSSNGGYYSAYMTRFSDGYLMPNGHSNYWGDEVAVTSFGYSVRLVSSTQDNPSVSLPQVSTTTVTNITFSMATFGGNVISDGGSDIVKRGICWSTAPHPTIDGIHSSIDSGSDAFSIWVSGLAPATTYYVRAFASNRAGIAYGNEVSFVTLTDSGVVTPVGAINGLFTVAPGCQTYFSQGNLQYQASTDTWQFAQHQYDYVGTANSNISQTYSGWIDLFGWGTSGYNHGAVCYQPWSISTNVNDYYAYGSGSYNLYDGNGQADWGYNPISNGGNQVAQWRTMSRSELNYLLSERITPSNMHYAKANVNGVNGLIILPDNWNPLVYALNNVDEPGSNASFENNSISASQWAVLEQAGVVFLPAAGNRFGIEVSDCGVCGDYWSSSCSDNNRVYELFFSGYQVSYEDYDPYRRMGYSVRLVHDAESTPPSAQLPQVIFGPILSTNNSASIIGIVVSDGGAAVTERGVCWSTNSNPSIGGNHISAGSGVGDFSVTIQGLESATTYYVRAYATNSVGTAYSDEESFTTYSGGGPDTPEPPQGTINGLFSVSDWHQVYFSQGNLQYQASTNTWRFAENQWDYVGEGNNYISSSYNGWIDLFGWGTSGYNHGAVCYQPWSTSQNDYDYLVYGSVDYNLYDQTSQADWGYNAISNGNDSSSIWRTLTAEEWTYLLNNRQTSSGIRYSKARVNEVNGVILLPDNWDPASYPLYDTDDPYVEYGSNVVPLSQWTGMELLGAVFLPSAGGRNGNDVQYLGDGGSYWSSCYYPNEEPTASILSFNNYNLLTPNVCISSRYLGYSVRLIRSNHSNPYTGELPQVSTSDITDISSHSATCGGMVISDGGMAVTERGICWNHGGSFSTVNDHVLSCGEGTGSFSVEMTDLEFDQAYYVRAYAINAGGVSYGEMKWFYISSWYVWTEYINQITSNSAYYVGGSSSGTNPAVVKGACWSTHPNPTLEDNHTAEPYNNNGSIFGFIYNLAPNTTYYLRTYVTDDVQTYYGNELSFTTLPEGGGDHAYVDLGLPSGTLWATCNVGANAPEEYGDYFAWGETQPKDYYNWSTYQYCMGSFNTLTKYCNNSNYGYNGFTDNLTTLLPEDDVATANWGADWRMPTYDEWWELYNNTSYSWTIQNGVYGLLFTASNGNGLFLPAAGYRLNSGLYDADSYGHYWSSSLRVDGSDLAWFLYFSSGFYNMANQARFNGRCVRAVRSSQNVAPQGAINGLFSVGEDVGSNGSSIRQVYFSQGNLQYQTSTNTWKFAENQWDYVGEGNNNISPTYDGWIDLFGWGTSGYDHGAVCYQPWSTDMSYTNYYAYGNSEYNLYDQTGQADWGYNAISNGGNQEQEWRTLTQAEWDYLLNVRNTSSGIRYAFAAVNGVKGLVLVPDGWVGDNFSFGNPNTMGVAYSSNVIDADTWEIQLGNRGFVFLPAVGLRLSNTIENFGENGLYWASDCDDSDLNPYYAHHIDFYEIEPYPMVFSNRQDGMSVRLVQDAPNGSGSGSGGGGGHK